METNGASVEANTRKAGVGRSPAYPFIPLHEAIARADELRQQEGNHSVPITSAYKAWGYGENSSGGRQTASALSYYGLVQIEGKGQNRSLRLADLAVRILLDKRENSQERDDLVRTAALNPQIHKDVRQRFPGELPSDATIETYLTLERGFSERGATSFVQIFRKTLSFAGLDGSANDNAAIEIDVSGDVPESSTIVEVEETPLDDVNTGSVPLKQDIFSLDEGDVILKWPSTLSSNSFEDLKDWLTLMEKKIGRAVTDDDPHNESTA